MTKKDCQHHVLRRAKTGGWFCYDNVDCDFRIAEPAHEPTRDIPTWRERCETHPEHHGGAIVTSRMIERRMQEEIDDLRNALNRQAEPPAEPVIRPRVFRGNGPGCLGCGKDIDAHVTGYYFCPGLPEDDLRVNRRGES